MNNHTVGNKRSNMAILTIKLILAKVLPKRANIIDNTSITIEGKEYQVLNMAQWLK